MQRSVHTAENALLRDLKVPSLRSLMVRSRAGLPEWSRHLMMVELVVVSGMLFKFIEEPSRKYLVQKIDEAFKKDGVNSKHQIETSPNEDVVVGNVVPNSEP